MARINIDDSIHSDPRFIALMIALGGDYYKALGLIVSAWKMGQKYHKEKNGLIPFEVWSKAPFEQILDCGLAEKYEEGIYVKGSRDQFAWISQKVEAGKKGGRKSADKRSNKPKQSQAGASNSSSDSKRSPSGSNPPTPPLPHSLTPSPAFDLTINEEMRELRNKLKSMGVTITPDHIIDLFNSKLANTGKLKMCRALDPDSTLHMLRTFELFPKLQDWEELFAEVKKAKKITGEIKGGVFLATLDWLAVKKNALKVTSGKYDLDSDSDENQIDIDMSEQEIEQLKEAGEL